MINLLLCGNKKVFDGALTQLISMTKRTQETINCYILTMDLSRLKPEYVCITDEQVEFLNEVIKSKNPQNKVTKIDVTNLYEEEFMKCKNESAYCTPYTLLRLLIDEIPNIPDKILYLDIDMMIGDDISKLYNIDIDGYEYAAVREKYGRWLIRPDYINAGMLLFNMKMAKETKLFEKARNLIRTRKLLFADQDAIFWSTTKKKLLPRKFNEQSKFNRKDTVVCHFCKRLLLKPYPHTENFKQWNVEEVHNILKCHAFDEDLEEYLKGKINLSYSSMNNYYLCAFRFYIENVLKLDPFTDTFAAFLGNLFHDCLSKMYEDGFDLKSNYEAYLSKKELNAKEKFFCEKLYTNLEFIIRTIRFQEGYSKYNKVLTEKHISVDKSSKLKINFLGFVDKIKYLEEDNGRWLVAIIDYKTGSVETTLDNINYGLHLQLPVYIYLTKNGLHKNIKITGFYLQKILNNSSVDCDDVEEDLRKKLKLDGFTIDDEDLINKFDSSYENSEVIKGMSVTSKGFSRYAKLVSSENIEKISSLVDEKIDEVVGSIDNVNFDINPKRINGELVGCQFCNFKDVCFRKEEDIVDLEYTKLEDILSD